MASLAGEGPLFVHGQRYAMGTMFDIAVYHPARAQAEGAIEAALAEIVRLDRVLSHYSADSDVSRLVRSSRGRLVTVDPALYDVLSQSVEMSRLSGGSFDVTIGPLVRIWEAAQARGSVPSPEAIANVRRCVGYEQVKLVGPGRVQLDSDCLSIDFGGIGKGYAVERAMRTLEGSGIAHAVINAGGSSIAAVGHPPDRAGWLITPGPNGSGLGEIELRDSSLSISRQARVPLGGGTRGYGGILDPARGRPVESSTTVVVTAASATHADALSTTLVLLSIEEGKRLLQEFPLASARWIAADGKVLARHGDVGAAAVKR